MLFHSTSQKFALKMQIRRESNQQQEWSQEVVGIGYTGNRTSTQQHRSLGLHTLKQSEPWGATIGFFFNSRTWNSISRNEHARIRLNESSTEQLPKEIASEYFRKHAAKHAWRKKLMESYRENDAMPQNENCINCIVCHSSRDDTENISIAICAPS